MIQWPNLLSARTDINQAQGSIVLGIDNFRKGSTAPTDETVGSTPTIPVLRFDATGELVSTTVVIPTDWDKGADIEVMLMVSLVNGQTNDDEISFTMDYTIVSQNTTGEGIAKTSSQVLMTKAVTTANGLAAGDIYFIEGTLSKDDANNGFALGDSSVAVCLELHLTNLTDVAAIHGVGGCLLYKKLWVAHG